MPRFSAHVQVPVDYDLLVCRDLLAYVHIVFPCPPPDPMSAIQMALAVSKTGTDLIT